MPRYARLLACIAPVGAYGNTNNYHTSREIATELFEGFYSEICPKTGQKRAMEPVRRRWKPLQTLTFSDLERQIGSVSCKKASLRPRSQTLENARTAGICGVDRAVYGVGPFSCSLFVGGKSTEAAVTQPGEAATAHHLLPGRTRCGRSGSLQPYFGAAFPRTATVGTPSRHRYSASHHGAGE